MKISDESLKVCAENLYLAGLTGHRATMVQSMARELRAAREVVAAAEYVEQSGSLEELGNRFGAVGAALTAYNQATGEDQ